MRATGGKSEVADAGLSSMRAYSKRRILVDMVESVRNHSRYSQEYLILVVDTPAMKVFSSCCQLYELVSTSRIYHIEKLEKKRKRFKKTDAIYFITPSEASIAMINDDFVDDTVGYKYGAVHLCFTSHVTDELLTPLARNKVLAPRVASFCEINLDFYLFNDNVFHLNMRNSLPLFKVLDDNPDFIQTTVFQKMRDQITHRLLTVCTVYDEFPNV